MLELSNSLSYFSMVLPTKANVYLDSFNMGHDQIIGIILCHFQKSPIIYPVGPVYYCPGHPSNTILLDALKFNVGFQKLISETLEYCDLVNPQGRSWRSKYVTQHNLDYLQIEVVKVKPILKKEVVTPNICGLSTPHYIETIPPIFWSCIHPKAKEYGKEGLITWSTL